MVDVSEERFAELVEAAFDAVPTELAALLDNVVLFIEDDAPADEPPPPLLPVPGTFVLAIFLTVIKPAAMVAIILAIAKPGMAPVTGFLAVFFKILLAAK